MKQNYKNITYQIIDGLLVRWQRALNLVLLDLQTCFLGKVILIVVLVLGEVTGCNLGVLPENYQRNSDDIQLYNLTLLELIVGNRFEISTKKFDISKPILTQNQTLSRHITIIWSK